MNLQQSPRINTPRDLIEIRERTKKAMGIRLPEGLQHTPQSAGGASYHVMLCFGTGCISSGAVEVRKTFVDEFEKHKIADRVTLVETGCNGLCAGGPIVVVYPKGYFYRKIQPADAAQIVAEHLVKGEPVERLLFHDPDTGKIIPLYRDIPFFAKQNVRVLHNKGLIAAESIDEYIARDGYFALAKALNEMTPESIIAEIKKSGLRGRGGAGFPTGTKWEFCRGASGPTKYILCNADEGDPGAFMDRSLLESDPHAVLEGMMIGARAIGAETGVIYCRAEYPLALERLQHAIALCKERGLIGKNILGTGFNFDVSISKGSGAFVCGEETALIASIEGNRGEPRTRPPFPATKGLWGKPSALNNVETFGNVPLIIRHGAEWFTSVGTPKSPGTKIFALTGKVKNIGLVEVSMGIPLREIIFTIGGGIPGGKKFKAAQIGGPSGGCIPAEHLDVPIDYESVAALGAIVGSGGLIVMDEDSCMVDVSRFFLEFTQDESCGKCVPCREGTLRMLQLLTKICNGKGTDKDLEILTRLANTVKSTSLCGFGQTASNPVLSTLRHFHEEYVEHIRDKKCRAAVCKALISFEITDACTGCGACKRACPVKCITGTPKNRHVIDRAACIRCGMCQSVCKFSAVLRR
jgi:NADH:ubiquinone oxidoreductase subunit F (NADH-binding)/(2Fe-2S) ferredoxin/NAD-dependent dihydropyrimidine dehydrogenase PreA subunit